MRIAMITDSYLPTRDGVVTAVTMSKKGLEAKGHEVVVIAPDPGNEEQREEGTVYFPACRFPSYPGYFVPIFPSNKMEIIRNLNVDLIHSQGQLTMAVRAMLAGRHLGLPVVVSFNTMVTEAMQYYSPIPLEWNLAEKLFWVYFRVLLHRADAVTTLTDAIGRELLQHAPDIRLLETVPIGIELERFALDIDGSEVRRRFGVEGKRVMLHVARISYEKNMELVLNAMRHMEEDVVLMMVGSGPAEPMVRSLVEELGIEDRVVFTGYVPYEELHKYYAAADGLVIASKFETQGLVVIEAMACGVPVAAIGYRALLETVVDGHNGFLFDDDVESCARAMKDCLSADGAMRANARRTAERFSLESCADRLLEVYRKAIDIKSERMRGKR